MLERFLILWLVLSSALAYVWPQWFSGTWDPFKAGVASLSYSIALTMFAIGAMLPADEVRQVARRWPTVLGGTAIQYTVMPLLAFTCGRLFALEPAAMIGIAMVGCVPGAMASNVLTLNARGNTSYSVSLTTAATLLSPAAVPAGLWLLLSDRVTIDPWAVSGNLLLTVVLPVVAGHVAGRMLTRREAAVRWVGSKIANLAILWIIAVVVGLHREHLTDLQGNVLAALLAINAGGYLAGWFGGRLLGITQPMRRALTLEIGMQNAGLGAVLATTFFKDQPQAAIAPALYTFGCMLTGTALATVWRQLGSGASPEDRPSEDQIRDPKH